MITDLSKIFSISHISRINFREDINGLRAIAVLSVVFYHAEIDLFKGGWIGVDIFFVISGYLISNIIVSELNEGTFTFKNFYLRRIKRILPALITTILTTIPFAYILLSPKAMQEFVYSLISSIFFYSNYYFANLDFYIAESTKFMPFLHTWSLAIEEQFYIFFPLITFIIYKYFAKYLSFFIFTFLFASLYINTLSQNSDKFYLLEFRAWELLMGVLVMILRNNFYLKHLEKIGLPLMLFPIFYFGENSINETEPKIIALLGVSLIIFSNKNNSTISKLLSQKFFKIIGLSSFSIYLLHQPIFAFFSIYKSLYSNSLDSFYKINFLESILLIFFIILISYFQYLLVEKQKNLKLVLLGTIAILIFSIIGILTSGYETRVEKNNLTYEAILYQDIKKFDLVIDNEVCHKYSDKIKITELCKITNNPEYKEILIVGDSHSQTFLKPFSEMNKENSIIFLTGSSCMSFTNKINPFCNRNDKENIPKLLSSTENKIIIWFADLNGKFEDPIRDVVKNVPITINTLAKKNIVIVIKQIPPFPYSVRDRILTNSTKNFKNKYPSYKFLNSQLYKETEKIYDSFSETNIYLIDSYEIFCEEIEKNFCVGSNSEHIYIYDSEHPTVRGSTLIANKVMKIIESINSQTKK